MHFLIEIVHFGSQYFKGEYWGVFRCFPSIQFWEYWSWVLDIFWYYSSVKLTKNDGWSRLFKYPLQQSK